ncbi:SIR2 family protein [Flaviflagellibacter deserti]|uniref:SIR2 family protein n=1 Tax=Flaviflagellibacter deserti TaxID=2267266 RepID=A0ABV9YZK2_9HYPH
MKFEGQYFTEMRETLLAGRYSLFLGAGASIDSLDSTGAQLPGGDALRQRLVALKKLKPTSSLARAYAQLTPDEVEKHITEQLSDCTPGPTARKITEFFWRSIYSLNIDDVLENVPHNTSKRQTYVPLTHKSPFAYPDDINIVQVIHVHGWVGAPDDGYIFSLNEYAKTLGPSNHWVNVLAQTIATEPFIIAGTSLEEPDLEYFLAARSASSTRKDRGPSFLIEPFPDAGTEAECARHGLTLFPGTLLEFLNLIDSEFPARPLPVGNNAKLDIALFDTSVNATQLALFSADFRYVVAEQSKENTELGFYIGREPSFSDLALSRDVSRASTIMVKQQIRDTLKAPNKNSHFLIFEDNAGTGKTTLVKRAIYDLAAEGNHVFNRDQLSAIDISRASKIFNSFTKPFIIFSDNFADTASAISELYRQIHRDDFLIVGTERSYRVPHALKSMGGIPVQRRHLEKFRSTEARDLILKMDGYGMTGVPINAENIEKLSSDLTTDSIAIAVCRILQNFKPVSKIIESLVSDSDNDRRERYLACALAFFCFHGGLRYNILVSAFGAEKLDEQMNVRDMLPLIFSESDHREYVIPANPVLAENILRTVAAEDKDLIFDVYSRVGAYLSSYVNRRAIIRRTPEASLAGRLFNYDDVVINLIPEQSEKFFLAMKRYWDWNSRYWEQFALLKLDQASRAKGDEKAQLLVQAIAHAKHAVQVERHPHPLTTLGKVLIEEMKFNSSRFNSAFVEALNVLGEAASQENRMNRIAVHPYTTLFNGAHYFLQNGGSLTKREVDRLSRLLNNADTYFNYDNSLMVLSQNVRRLLGTA